MGKKYFVISDIHSFYVEMKTALYTAGFRKKNKDHILIVIGDIFDRGPDALKVYKYLMSIPKCRRIMIKGNHEDLYLELLKKSYPDKYDYSNGTVDTFLQISNSSMGTIYDEGWDYIAKQVSENAITEWLKSDEWKNYYELGPYIFTHSFVPTQVKKEFEYALIGYSPLYLPVDYFTARADWRNASEADWYWARWGCPYEQYRCGLFDEPNKTLVVGHWHTSDFFVNLKNNYRYCRECGPIYYSSGIIGIDGGVMRDYLSGNLVHPQNVLIIDEQSWKCYDKFGNELVEEKAIPKIETTRLADSDFASDIEILENKEIN